MENLIFCAMTNTNLILIGKTDRNNALANQLTGSYMRATLAFNGF